MTPVEESVLEYTAAHFEEIARQNRYAENYAVSHDVSRCVICRPELVDADPFPLYLEVAARSVLVRRPRLDRELVDAINDDLALSGEEFRVSLESCTTGEERAIRAWREWVRNALATGLGLLSIHSPASLEFDIDEEEAAGHGESIRERIAAILSAQKAEAGSPRDAVDS